MEQNEIQQIEHRSQSELLQSLMAQAAAKCFGQFQGQTWDADLHKSDDYKALELQAFVELNRS